MSHANAALTPKARLKLARLIVEDSWSVARAAERFQVSANREAVGRPVPPARAGRHAGPQLPAAATAAQDAAATGSRDCAVRIKRRVGPVEMAGIVDLPASTVHAVLRRCGISRLSTLDRATGERVRRYEHPHAGALLHQDVKELGNIPDGGGHRMVGRQQGRKHRAATPNKPRRAYRDKKMGHAVVHTVVDDYSRVAYAKFTTTRPRRPRPPSYAAQLFWFAARGVLVERVLTDKGCCYRSRLWRGQCQDLDIKHKRTRPYRPQTNGKGDRFLRTMTAGWAFRRLYLSESARRKALPGRLHEYNHHRDHPAIDKVPPISRLTNLPGQYS